MIRTIAQGVKTLHDKNVIHRDLRIQAIKVEEHSKYNNLKIGDFDLAICTSGKNGLLKQSFDLEGRHFAPEI